MTTAGGWLAIVTLEFGLQRGSAGIAAKRPNQIKSRTEKEAVIFAIGTIWQRSRRRQQKGAILNVSSRAENICSFFGMQSYDKRNSCPGE
jgi:hypothetical protein